MKYNRLNVKERFYQNSIGGTANTVTSSVLGAASQGMKPMSLTADPTKIPLTSVPRGVGLNVRGNRKIRIVDYKMRISFSPKTSSAAGAEVYFWLIRLPSNADEHIEAFDFKFREFFEAPQYYPEDKRMKRDGDVEHFMQVLWTKKLTLKPYAQAQIPNVAYHGWRGTHPIASYHQDIPLNRFMKGRVVEFHAGAAGGKIEDQKKNIYFLFLQARNMNVFNVPEVTNAPVVDGTWNWSWRANLRFVDGAGSNL